MDDECQDGASDVKTGGIKSGSQTLCFSLEKLCWHSTVVHLCQFENAPTHDWKARKCQEGSGLASSGRSRTWPTRDDVIASATGCQINQSNARSINNEPHLKPQFRTPARHFTSIMRMSWLKSNSGGLKKHVFWNFCCSFEQLFLVVLCTLPPLLSPTAALKCYCCSLHLHWGGCVKSCTTHLTLYYSPPEHTQSLLNYLQAIHLCWQTCSNCAPFLRPASDCWFQNTFRSHSKKRKGMEN